MVTKISLAKLWLDKHSSQAFYGKKKQNWEEFLEHVVSEDYKCDEVGLFLFTRMFHMQLGVIVNGVAWTTDFKQDLKQCDVVLGYKGCCQFVLLQKLEPGETVQDDMSMLSKFPRIVHLHPFG